MINDTENEQVKYEKNNYNILGFLDLEHTGKVIFYNKK